MARPPEAEDIAQEALLTVLRRLPTYRGEGRFEHWVDRITQRVAFAVSRRHRAERNLMLAFEYLPANRAFAQDVDHQLTFRSVVRLLDDLPIEQGYAIMLHYLYGMSVPEIAQALDIPVETARSRLRLARAKTRARTRDD